jgi:hypothetical protein
MITTMLQSDLGEQRRGTVICLPFAAAVQHER